MNHPIPPLKLERALGLTALSNAAFCSSSSGDIFYAAGCFVVRYNPEENKQKGFYKANKAVSSIAVSDDGKYLAIGERGQTPMISIWNVERYETVVSLACHQHGIGCMAFSPNGRYLVTVGYRMDRQLVMWDWRTKQKVTTQKLGNRVHSISFHHSGDYFVTAGDRHLKWWTITEVLEGEAVSLEGKAASILEDMRNSVFMDVVCGSGSCDSQVFCTTSTGVLCLFNGEKMVEKWVQLESASSFCLELLAPEGAAGLLIVGCANGIIRCFDPLTLQYIATLPLPAPLLGALPRTELAGGAAAVGNNQLATQHMYAACYGVRKVANTRTNAPPKLATIYADRSLFVWNIADIYEISKYRSFQFHRACIWDVQFVDNSAHQGSSEDGTTSAAQQPALPPGTFVTCSADNTIRFWNTDSRRQRESKHRSLHSREMLHCIDLLADIPPNANAAVDAQNTSVDTFDARTGTANLGASISMTHYFAQQSHSTADLDICEGVPDLELPDRPQSKYAPRTLAVHPYGHELACGDKMGTLMIFDIRGMRQISAVPAHAAEILALSYSPALAQDAEGTWMLREAGAAVHPAKEAVLLASAGRDRLIHIYNANQHYQPLQTLDQHASSVTIAKFTADGRRFLSCGGDRTIVFSNLDGLTINRAKSVPTPQGAINGLAVEASNKFAVTSGQDKRLNIWNLQSGKHMRAYRSEHIHSELYKSDIDPSGTYIATCAFDKTISVFDFFSGELVTQVAGHSELVTGVKFSPDGRHLLSIGGDGCIFVWRVAESLVKAMQDRLMELMSNAQRRNIKATAAVRRSQHAEGARLEAPPPLPAPTFGLPAHSQAAPAAPPLPSTIGLGASTDSKTSAGSAPKSRWAERVQQEHGYELFGKKIDPTATPDHNRNKFTLELTSTTRANLAVASPPVGPEKEPTEESAVSGLGLSGSGRRGDALEAGDDVMQSALSGSDTEDEGDGSELFKPAALGASSDTEPEYDSDFEAATGESAATGQEAVDLDKTQDDIENLQKSAEHIENWLENMIRGEAKLDEEALAPAEAVTAEPELPSPSEADVAAAPVKRVHNRRVINKTTGAVSARPVVAGLPGPLQFPSEGGDPLDRSLSSAFFHNLRKSGVDGAPAVGGLSSAATAHPSTESAAETPAQAKERRQRETAAALSQMQGLLRGMGILEGTKRAGESSHESTARSPSTSERSSSKRSAKTPAGKEGSSGPASAGDDGYDTASTASEPEPDETDVLNQSALIANEVAKKAHKYRNVLRELDAAKRKAAESLQELTNLRQSLDKSMRESVQQRSKHQRVPSTASIPENDVLDVSMAQVDELLLQFQDSLAGLGSTTGGALMTGSRKSQGAPSSTSSVLGFSRSTESAQLSESGLGSGVDMDAFLERYSERLADMVGEKLLSRMNASNPLNLNGTKRTSTPL